MGEKNTFVRRMGTGLFDSRGVMGRSYIRNNSLGNCLSTNFVLDRHSTVHLRNSNAVDWIEIGWARQLTIDLHYKAYGFIEWGKNLDEAQGYREFGSNCAENGTVAENHWAGFKLYHLSGNNGAWVFEYDNNNDGVYECSPGVFVLVDFYSGLATGETGIIGGDDTDAYDHFYGMKYATQLDNQGWTKFGGNFTYAQPYPYHCIPGYGRHGIAVDDWELIKPGAPCPE